MREDQNAEASINLSNEPPMTAKNASGAEWLTVTEAALRVGKSERTVQRWCQKATVTARLVTTPDGEAWQIEAASLPASAVIGAHQVTPFQEPVTPYGAQVTPPGDATSDAIIQSSDATKYEGDAIRCADRQEVTPQGDAIFSPGDATPPGAQIDSYEARYVAQLERENTFLRTQIEEKDRNTAELRAALREALKLSNKALPAPGDVTTSQSTPPDTSGATNTPPGAQIGAQKSGKPRRRRGWLGWFSRS
jgi:hypothetical protein